MITIRPQSLSVSAHNFIFVLFLLTAFTTTSAQNVNCGVGLNCSASFCCSSSGFCGRTDAYCGTGCNTAYGVCGVVPAAGTPSVNCGAGFNASCSSGQCCSNTGFCGTSEDYCGLGCQAGFGNCGVAATGSTSNPSSGSNNNSGGSNNSNNSGGSSNNNNSNNNNNSGTGNSNNSPTGANTGNPSSPTGGVPPGQSAVSGQSPSSGQNPTSAQNPSGVSQTLNPNSSPAATNPSTNPSGSSATLSSMISGTSTTSANSSATNIFPAINPNSNTPYNSNSGIQLPVLLAIIFGALLFLAILAGVAYYLRREYRRRHPAQDSFGEIEWVVPPPRTTDGQPVMTQRDVSHQRESSARLVAPSIHSDNGSEADEDRFVATGRNDPFTTDVANAFPMPPVRISLIPEHDLGIRQGL